MSQFFRNLKKQGKMVKIKENAPRKNQKLFFPHPTVYLINSNPVIVAQFHYHVTDFLAIYDFHSQ